MSLIYSEDQQQKGCDKSSIETHINIPLSLTKPTLFFDSLRYLGYSLPLKTKDVSPLEFLVLLF